MSHARLFTSRFALATSFVLALSSFASADRAYAPPAHFAEPPAAGLMAPVEAQPRALDRASVRAALAHVRASNLAAFRAYQQKGVFPSNTFEAKTLNVWRDRDGHLCAAATIIDASGQHDLVARVADQSNFIRLADVRQGPLMDWILTSGFTQDEIAAIQEPFMPVAKPRMPVEPDLRTAEDARLRAKYKAVTRMLVANEKHS
ncbi:MAG: hypothetical protein ACM31C_18640, partial [Acidobacteriota bacterium]